MVRRRAANAATAKAMDGTSISTTSTSTSTTSTSTTNSSSSAADEQGKYPCECGRIFETGGGRGSHKKYKCPLRLKMEGTEEERGEGDYNPEAVEAEAEAEAEAKLKFECACGRRFQTPGGRGSHQRLCEVHHQAKSAAEETEKNFECEEEREAAVTKPLAGSGGLHAVPAMVATEARKFPCECAFTTLSGRTVRVTVKTGAGNARVVSNPSL